MALVGALVMRLVTGQVPAALLRTDITQDSQYQLPIRVNCVFCSYKEGNIRGVTILSTLLALAA